MPAFNEPVEAEDNGTTGYGVRGASGRGGLGVLGDSDSVGVYGGSSDGIGVQGASNNNVGVYGEGGNDGVQGFSSSTTGSGVYGKNTGGEFGVAAGAGVYGESYNGSGVYALSRGETFALYARGEQGYAAYLVGQVVMTGPVTAPGKSFKIDHPLEPANKYLCHSVVESPDMKNVYDGVVTLDDKGEAVIELPDWFGALNKDFRYQLTAIGAPGPNLYISEEISDGVAAPNYYNNSGDNKNNNSRFKVAGGTSGMKVSWQVTGIRKDPWANAHRIPVEEDKPPKERGYYTYPELYSQPEERGINHLLVPEIRERAAAPHK